MIRENEHYRVHLKIPNNIYIYGWMLYIVILETIFTVLYHKIFAGAGAADTTALLVLLVLLFLSLLLLHGCSFANIYTMEMSGRNKSSNNNNNNKNTYIFAWDEKQEKCTKQIL